MGLNFYGWQYAQSGAGTGPQAMLGAHFEALSAKHPGSLVWDADAHEHRLKLPQGEAWYPSVQVQSLPLRAQLLHFLTFSI